MLIRLGPLLDTSDLPRAELCALRLDGEVFDVDELASPIDQLDTPDLRAAAFARIAPAGAVAEAGSALWIYGILASAPGVHSAAVAVTRRVDSPRLARIRLRQATMHGEDVVTFGSVMVMSPLRTLLDLTRLTDGWTNQDSRTAASVIALGHVDKRAWKRRLNGPHHLPYKRRAFARIGDALALLAGAQGSGQPALTR